ncbi:MAG: AzlC family ABC transporter permease [Arenicella sp.]|nr:AzlC family ABC transporter permease [Arenicella sp.]
MTQIRSQASACRTSNSSLTRRAILDTMPLSLAVIPWGVLTGALAIEAGFSAIQAQLMSLIVFAGAAQLSAITLLAAGSSFASIFASTVVISSRHLLYSITFRQHVEALPLRLRLVIGFLLTDEMFAVSQAHTMRSGNFSALFAIVSGATFYFCWNISTLLGIIAGEYFSDLDSMGLDFAIVATFIAMTFAELRNYPILVAVLMSGLTAVLLQPLLSDSYIVIAALVGMSCAYICPDPQAMAELKVSS